MSGLWKKKMSLVHTHRDLGLFGTQMAKAGGRKCRRVQLVQNIFVFLKAGF